MAAVLQHWSSYVCSLWPCPLPDSDIPLVCPCCCWRGVASGALEGSFLSGALQRRGKPRARAALEHRLRERAPSAETPGTWVMDCAAPFGLLENLFLFGSKGFFGV